MELMKRKESKNGNAVSRSIKSVLKILTIQCLICAGAIAFISLISTSVSASVIVYDNTTTSSLSSISMGGRFFGDEISLGPGPRNIVEFRFDYDLYLSKDEDIIGNETATIKFYQNNGPGGAPNTVLYNSGPVSISPGYNTLTLSIPDILVPDTFTWMVLFEGVYQGTSNPSIPWLVEFDPPTIGSSDHFFWWEGTPGSYTKLPSDYNFNARVTATPVPATILLLGSGLIGLAGFRCKRKLDRL